MLVRIVAAGGLLVLLIWLAAAWYFSDVLYEDGLRVAPPPLAPVADVEVVALDDDSVTLRPGEDRPEEVGAPGLWGLWWPEGYGAVSEIESRSGETVTREFRPVTGSAPGIGTLVDVDKYVYGDTPDQVLGLEWDMVELRTPLGTQDAWWVPTGGEPSETGARTTWAILVHGKGSGPEEMLRMLRTVHEVGLPALVITYRGDRDQPVDPSRVYRFGATEWEDLDAAVAHARTQGASDVVLLGASTGAALIGSWFEKIDDGEAAPAPVSAVVLDSPNADVERVFAYGASQRTIPGTDWPLPAALAWTAFRLSELRFPLSFAEVDYSDELATVDAPALVFQGTGDRTVPVAATRDLVAARQETGLATAYVETDAGEHVGSYNHDPTTYEAALEDFLRERTGN